MTPPGLPNASKWLNLFPEDPLTILRGIASGQFDTLLFGYVIIYITMFVALSMTAIVAWRSNRCYRKVVFLFEVLRGLNKDNFAENRDRILQVTQEDQLVGQIWEEFDHTLVETVDRTMVFKTVEAEQYFDQRNFLGGITENRLISATPGILTALGILGTFIGLQLGISDLFQGGDGDPNTLKRNIDALLAGVSVKFSTSVWGIGTSLMFNIVERVLEHHYIRKPIVALQHRINALFYPKTPEDSLVKIENSSRGTEQALKGFADRVGQEIGQALSGVSTELARSIERSIVPAAESLAAVTWELAQKQATGSEDAMRQLVERFIGSVTEQARKQQFELDSVAQRVEGAVKSLGEVMSAFAGSLTTHTSQTDIREASRTGELDKQLAQLRKFQESSGKDLAQLLTDQVRSSVAVAERSEHLLNRMMGAQGMFERLGGEIERAALTMRDSMNGASTLSDGLRRAAENLSGRQLEAAQIAERVVIGTEGTARTIAKTASEFELTRGQLREVGEFLAKTATVLGGGLNEYAAKQEKFLDELGIKLGWMQDQVAVLMQDYSEQVHRQTNERLEEWNRHTRDFSSSMVEASQMMREILDDIEDKLGARQGR